MADKQRGDRIKARREELHLTQPVTVELMEELAWQLPATHRLHPDFVRTAKGDESLRPKPPVTLRGLQTWEAGGGVDWEKAKLLAQVLKTDVQAMMHGAPEDEGPPETPSPFADPDERMRGMETRLMEQADIIRGLLETQNGLLARQSGILDDIRAATRKENDAADRLEDATQRADEAASTLGAVVAEARSVFRAGAQSPAARATKPARKRTPKAAPPESP